MSNKSAKIEKIVVDMHGSKLELTPNQAKELRDILCEMFGGKVVTERHDHHHWPYQNWYWNPMTYTAPSPIISGSICASATGSANQIDTTSNAVYLAAA